MSVPEYNLTGEFCRKHFLTGLLLRELGLALQDEQDLRHLALATLKTLMAKHSLDARYATKVDGRHVYTGGGNQNGINESFPQSRNSSSVTHANTCTRRHVTVGSSCGQRQRCVLMNGGKYPRYSRSESLIDPLLNAYQIVPTTTQQWRWSGDLIGPS